MDDQITLGKAIQKAIDGGYDRESGETALAMLPDVFASEEYPRNHFIRGLVFDHAFAKALWGEKIALDYFPWSDEQYCEEEWKYHLIQMLVADNSIKYLGEHM